MIIQIFWTMKRTWSRFESIEYHTKRKNELDILSNSNWKVRTFSVNTTIFIEWISVIQQRLLCDKLIGIKVIIRQRPFGNNQYKKSQCNPDLNMTWRTQELGSLKTRLSFLGNVCKEHLQLRNSLRLSEDLSLS